MRRGRTDGDGKREVRFLLFLAAAGWRCRLSSHVIQSIESILRTDLTWFCGTVTLSYCHVVRVVVPYSVFRVEVFGVWSGVREG